MERKLTTVMAMDVVGYARLMERDETGTLDRLKDTRSSVIDPTIQRHAGRTIKVMGDGSLVEFSSVVGALLCAVEIQREIARRSASIDDDRKLQLRIGVHLGDVIIEGADIYGDGVNVAARLESIAQPGGIVLSQQVHDHIGSNVPVQLISLGEQSVKNISRAIQAYSVVVEPELTSPHVIRFDDFELDSAVFQLRKAATPVPVEPQVFDLLVFLAKNQGRTVTKDEIFSTIWGDRIVSDAALSSRVKAARRALGDDGASQRMIATVHGRGFRFLPTIKSAAPAVPPAENGRRQAIDLGAMARGPTVALLPFTNLNRDPDENFLADGISEDITTALAKNRWFTVIARNPAFAFRTSNDSIRSIGEKLGADYIVTGSIRKAGTRLRITAQVVEADTEHSVWSERFDRDLVDVFVLQDEISEMITARIEAELGISEQRKAERRSRKNLGAWELCQLAAAEFYKFTQDSNLRCQELLRQAVEIDPGLASAHSRLAYGIVLSMVYFDAPPDAARMDEALASARRAIELDDQDANSYFTIGRVHLARCEYDRAIEALQYALELNPCLAVTHCGLGDSLAYEGRLDEAIEHFEIAVKLSPHDPFRWAFYSYRSLAHLFRGEFAEAVSWARRAILIPNVQYWARAHLVAALGHLGDRTQAAHAARELLDIKPSFSIAFAKEHLFYIKRRDQLDLYVEGLARAGVPDGTRGRRREPAERAREDKVRRGDAP